MKYPVKLTAAIIILFFFILNASAQKEFDCKKLLKQKIAADNAKTILDNVNKHADCFGLDSVDLRIYGQGPILGSMMVARASKNELITYGDILTGINKAKSDTSYASLRNLITAQMTLDKRRFTPGNWDSSIQYLKTIGMPDNEMEPFHAYAVEKQSHNWTYRQLVTGYRMKQEASAPAKQN